MNKILEATQKFNITNINVVLYYKNDSYDCEMFENDDGLFEELDKRFKEEVTFRHENTQEKPQTVFTVIEYPNDIVLNYLSLRLGKILRKILLDKEVEIGIKMTLQNKSHPEEYQQKSISIQEFEEYTEELAVKNNFYQNCLNKLINSSYIYNDEEEDFEKNDDATGLAQSLQVLINKNTDKELIKDKKKYCPNCNIEISDKYKNKTLRYCPCCGQKINRG